MVLNEITDRYVDIIKHDDYFASKRVYSEFSENELKAFVTEPVVTVGLKKYEMIGSVETVQIALTVYTSKFSPTGEALAIIERLKTICTSEDIAASRITIGKTKYSSSLDCMVTRLVFTR